MKLSALFGVAIGLFLTASIAFASGGQYFLDVEDGNWYTEAVHRLYQMGVVEGYSDGNFLPGEDVNRAEVVSMFDRFYDYLQYPSGEDWVEYSNDYYSVMLPHGAYSSTDCSVSDDLGLDVGFSVTCYSSADYSVSDLIATMGDQFEDNRREVRKNIQINGQDALWVSVTTTDYRTWEYNAVFLEDDADGMIYMISDAALNFADDFEYFYSTFKL